MSTPLRASVTAFAAMTVLPLLVSAQADMAPTNGLPNPYRTIEGWAKLPQGRSWGSTSSVEVDIDGVSIWPSMVISRVREPAVIRSPCATIPAGSGAQCWASATSGRPQRR
jgi:hypothetical protein